MMMMQCLLVAVILSVHAANAAFFDLTDIDDPLSLLWHTKDVVVGQRTKECTVKNSDGQLVSGQCQQKAHCLISGGLHSLGSGTCGILSTCCVYKRSCSRTTKSKVSYFTSGADSTPSICDYTVNVENNNICQMRLDFDDFQLTPPENVGSTNPSSRIICRNDQLTVAPNHYGIPELCGKNSGQHVYVHLEPRDKQVKLRVQLGPSAQKRSWRIKITQLECPGALDIFSSHKSFDLLNDYQSLAPRGALQYFYNATGYLRSFNFDDHTNQNEYNSGLRYAIAFLKTALYNCVEFTPNYLNLRTIQTDVDVIPSDADCLDYLELEQLSFTASPEELRSRVCLLPAAQTSFSSNAPGPVVVNFVSSSNPPLEDGAGVHGFDIRYELKNKC